MYKRVVYLGPYNNSMSEKLFNKAVDYLKKRKGHKFYYILPNGNLLVNYRKEMLNKINYAFDINLYTFDNIVDRLLKNKLYTAIDRGTKEIIVFNILKELNDAGKLNYYGEVSSRRRFSKSVSSIIGQLKRSLVTPKDYLSKCPDKPFYKEIGYIYEEYERILKNNKLMDREESYFYSLEILDEDIGVFDDLDFVVIDNFFDFRPQELELLKAITKTECSIYINMPFNRENNFHILNNTINILTSMGFEIERVDKESYTQYEKLSNVIFSSEDATVKCQTPINIIKAANEYLEIKKIAYEVKRHLSKGIDLEDMAIVLTNFESYKDKLSQVFEEEKIPIKLDRKISLMEVPLLKELIYILDTKRCYMDVNSIINRIKSSYYPLLEKSEREFIEYIIRKESINGLKKHGVGNIISSIKDESNSIPAKATLTQYVELVSEIIKKYKLEERILEFYEKLKDYNLARRDFLALNKFRQILNSIDGILSIIKAEVTLDEFIEIISNYLKNESIVDVEANANGINVLTPITARGKKYKVVFVTGMVQDNYPNIRNRSFFFKDDNYLDLKKIGIDVKNYYERLDKEFVLFCNIIASCSDTLYLSYPENSTEDDKAIQSTFLDEIKNKIKNKDGINEIVVEIDYIFKNNLEDITTKEELLNYILRAHPKLEDNNQILSIYDYTDEDIFEDIHMKIQCEYERQSSFNKYNGLIENDEIKKDLYNLHKNKTYSISYLETYRVCPYKFLLSKIFRLEEMKREYEELSPLDVGVIKHEVLKEYYFNYKDEIKEYIINDKKFNIEKTYDFIFNTIKDKMDLKLINKSPLERKLIELNNADIIFNFIKNDLKRMKSYKKKAIPYDFEVPFGKNNTFEIKVGDKSYRFTGIIDRIDKYIDEDKYIIIDYKSKKYGVKKIRDILEGLSFQLPIYIMSQDYKKIAAGIYGILYDGDFVEALIVEEEAKNFNKKRKSSNIISQSNLELILEDVKNYIKDTIDSIHEGDFSVNPTECDKYCEYKDICRYQEVSESND